jgi:CCR4-NOT transcription complex subunit 6
VGRCLKLEVRVLHSSNGAPLFHTPRVADTEPVLSSPPLPPKRMMATVKVRHTQSKTDKGKGAIADPCPCVWMCVDMYVWMLQQALAPGGVKLRVATYNVLAEIYASQQMYPYCDPWALAWNYRKVHLYPHHDRHHTESTGLLSELIDSIGLPAPSCLV